MNFVTFLTSLVYEAYVEHGFRIRKPNTQSRKFHEHAWLNQVDSRSRMDHECTLNSNARYVDSWIISVWLRFLVSKFVFWLAIFLDFFEVKVKSCLKGHFTMACTPDYMAYLWKMHQLALTWDTGSGRHLFVSSFKMSKSDRIWTTNLSLPLVRTLSLWFVVVFQGDPYQKQSSYSSA